MTSAKYQSLVGKTLEEAKSQTSSLGVQDISPVQSSEASSFTPPSDSSDTLYVVIGEDDTIQSIIEPQSSSER